MNSINEHETVYCDHNAHSPMPDFIRKTISKAFVSCVANPSSQHKAGRYASSLLEKARYNLAETLNCYTDEIVFMSSGSESNSTVLNLFTDSQNNIGNSKSIIVTKGEHASIIKNPNVNACIDLDRNGKVSTPSLIEAIKSFCPKLVSCHGANSETGVVQDLDVIRKITAKNSILFHADLSQYCGRLPFNFRNSKLDFATISSHKIGGPVGVSALLIKRGLSFKPLIYGGNHELERRAGTENVALILGFTEAMRYVNDNILQWDNINKLRLKLEASFKKINPSLIVIGEKVKRLPNTSCFLTGRTHPESDLIMFDQAGVFLSSGTACNSGMYDKPYALLNMGFSLNLARSMIRISLGIDSKAHDIDRIISVWKSIQ